ncbi:MAG: hypothetical protein R3B93_02920 [Bacteroidia bacterium]
MNTAKELRLDIIELLFKIDDIKILNLIRSQLEKKNKERREELPSFMEAATSLREDVSLEEIMKEQNYKTVSYEEYRQKVKSIQWEESLDELLAALTK